LEFSAFCRALVKTTAFHQLKCKSRQKVNSSYKADLQASSHCTHLQYNIVSALKNGLPSNHRVNVLIVARD